ncbi:ribosomal small subunit pseudouridine synthase A [Oceanospirillum multiglobuliferum]|uniref:Pseudouridine synthase n=1 Tax=Oceanospirillum multiglobuliferum TaxID=64969 RepID=A0A1T4N346_9GAMM|nr:16S rRNA pseudouridine(516) synthase RsuA [Oceanospirillum multiglobuliferum]OPX55815.1 16S rRNA pseudouridine(516) synthase [Oceanospirillum multiglobuliferum]SJZ73536.1 ribosomal small subunit pseudouridine synthase A [Oceanospirillum multiglobuliferum]
MRLDKMISHHTGLSRVEAKRVLRQGLVTVDEVVTKNAALHISSDNIVCYDGQTLGAVSKRYIMLNKPENTICSTIDEDYPSVLNLLDLNNTRDLHIAGRLDVDTTGLVLITDDGKWSHQITSPKKQCTKRYRVWLDEPLCDDAEAQLTAGLKLHGEKELTLPATLERINSQEVLLSISEGKYHQVKRMFAALNNKVTALHREKIGDIELDLDLNEGDWRYLTEAETNSVLKML